MEWLNIDPLALSDIVLLFLLLLTACAVLFIRDSLVSIILLGIFSLLMSAEYLVLGAPDVAITEAAVGAGISTLLLLCALSLVGKEEKPFSYGNVIPILVVLLTGVALFYAVSDMPVFGDPAAPANQHVAPHYITQSEHEIGIPNVVTSVLASYRGFDTFGETVVVMTAALSVWLLLGSTPKSTRNEDEGNS